jgi:hypothetical protein
MPEKKYKIELTQNQIEDLFDEFLDDNDQTRFDIQGGYPSQRMFYTGMAFVATVDHDDAPKLEMCDMRKFKQVVSDLVRKLCGERSLPSYKELTEHDDFELFWEELRRATWDLIE